MSITAALWTIDEKSIEYDGIESGTGAGPLMTDGCTKSLTASPSEGTPSAPQLAHQPCLRQAPVAHHALGRDVQELGGLVDRQPAKEPQLHDPRSSRIHDCQGLERLVQRDDV